MSGGLVRDIVRFHLAAEARAGDAWRTGDELPVRVDHVLAGGRAGLLALAAFERIAAGAPRTDVALASAERGAGPATFETPEELQALHALARRAGVRFSRPGHGRADTVHSERFAVPGRILCAAGRRAPACGALGMLGIAVDPSEAAAVLAGGALYLEWPGVVFAVFEGALPASTDGYDVRLTLARRLGPGAGGAFLECTGAGIGALEMGDRFALAAGADAFGARSVLLPSDEKTRAWLRAQGREPEWKPLAGAVVSGGEAAAVIDLTLTVPMLAPLGVPGDARAVSASAGAAISAIEIGDEATFADLARLADALEGRQVDAGVTLVVVPGSRQIMETARESGVLDRLVQAGARVLEPGTRGGSLGAAAGQSGLAAGVRLEDAEDPRAAWWAGSIATCAAAALEGRLCDPRGLPAGPGGATPVSFAATDGWIVRPGAADPAIDPAVDEPPAPFPLGAPIDGPLRGSVLAVLGDDVGAEGVLPWGARVRPLLGDAQRLAAFVFDGIVDAFPERARRHGGGWIVAGARFGHGVSREPAAHAPLALGVRGVIAVSLAADYRRHLLHAGILPLRFVVASDHADVQAGDELEIPGLPEALEEGVPLVVRNLTRGTRFTVRHDLNARQIDTAVAGGLLARVQRKMAREAV